ncbi:MAG TPA: hypothetical protein VKO67_03050 [Smithellaceae bacterium]|nr:hypothetical protein [Smithellaceae bacterium]
MKAIKYYTGIGLAVLLCVCLWACLKPVPVDVVIIGNDVCFVLEDEREVSAVQVTVFNPDKKDPRGKTMWMAGHDLATPVAERKYPRLKQIKYGQALNEFPQVIGPAPLKRNVEYLVAIDMGDKFAREVFIITDDNHIVMPRNKNKGESAR